MLRLSKQSSGLFAGFERVSSPSEPATTLFVIASECRARYVCVRLQ
jgi:hypothetical protein